MQLTPQLLQKYFGHPTRHKLLKEAEERYRELSVHADGTFPDRLVRERRPNESEHIYEYRRKIYEPKTKQPVGKVITELGKIRRSTDWSVSYDGTKRQPLVADGETLQEYCEENFPQFGSVGNWVFTLLLRKYLVDANAVMVVYPLNCKVKANEYVKPVPHIYHSDRVVEYIEDELLVVKLDPEAVPTPTGEYQAKAYLVANETEVRKYVQNTAGEYELDWQYAHKLGRLPVRKTGGIIRDMEGRYVLHESRISGMLPDLNEFVREYSDLQAEIVQHIFSERWEWASQQCTRCRSEHTGLSTGKVKSSGGKLIDCKECGGTGTTGISPYRKLVLRPANQNMGEQPAPIPPAGYIEKNTEIARLQDERLRKRTFDALAAINMQFLEQVPLSNSGVAKEVDRDALNNFVYSIAEDLVAMMDWLYLTIAQYRYGALVKTAAGIKAMLPKIAVPEKYDLLSATYLVDEIAKSKTSKINGIIVSALELDYVAKKFYNSPDTRDELQCVLRLDPLPQTTDDEKTARLQNGGIALEDYIISSNIQPFVRRALEEKSNFAHWPDGKKLELLREYAQEKLKAIGEGKAKPATDEEPVEEEVKPEVEEKPQEKEDNNPKEEELPALEDEEEKSL